MSETHTNGSKTMQAARYDYPTDGGYADTVATLADGRRVWVNTQYRTVDGADLSADDRAALIADARANGKFGRAARSPSRADVERNEREIAELDARRTSNGLCTKCGTYCHGDC